MRQVTYGLLLVILMLYRPQGLVGEYKLWPLSPLKGLKNNIIDDIVAKWKLPMWKIKLVRS
jgi:hypothetical protein